MRTPPAAVLPLVALCAAVVLSGCGEPERGPAAPTHKIAQGVTLRYWTPRWLESLRADKAGALELYRKLEEVTGIHIELVFPSGGSAQSQLESLKASGQMPDIMEWSWYRSYPGGPAKAIDDGLVASLGELIPQHAPNLFRLLQQAPEIARAIATPDGRYYAFPDLRSDAATRARSGPLIRKDWLDKVGMQPPESLEQWHEMLLQFKRTPFGTPFGGAEYPFFVLSYKPWLSDELTVPYFFDSNAFAGAYGLSHGFYRRGDAFAYGPALPEYRQVLELLLTWFQEGLIHPSVLDPEAGRNWIEVVAKCGAWIGGVDAASFLNPIKYVPAPLPRKGSSGDAATLGSAIPSAYGGSRSAASRYRTEAVRWLDVAYGEWGARLFNFGIEGSTYALRGGLPELTKEVVAEIERGGSVEGATVEGLYGYSRGILGGPFDLSVSLYRYHLEALMPGASGVVMGWQAGSYTDPLFLLGLDGASQERLPGVFGAIREHAERNVLALISGRRPLAELDRFAKELDELGLPEALELLRREDAATRTRPLVFR